MNEQSGAVWVTGAGIGIGHAIALRFAREGFTVYASGRREDKLSELALKAEPPGKIIALPCNVADASSVEAAYKRIESEEGGVEILINNAGVTVFKSFLASTVDEFDRLTEVNLRGVFLCTKAVLPGMVERSRGAVVIINSMAAKNVYKDSSVYSATKAGAKALADCLRHEVRENGVRVISVFPGATLTEIWPARVAEKYADRMMRPNDVADAVVHAVLQPQHLMVEEVVLQPIGGPL